MVRLVLMTLCVGLAAITATAGYAGAGNGQVDAGGTDHGAEIEGVTKAYVEQFYPLWLFYQQTRLAPHNELIGPDRISPIYQGVVAINDDTLYASTAVDLLARPVDPVILTVPSTDPDVSYSVLNLDPYGNIFDSAIPSKPAGTDAPTTVYGLVPAGYTGELPDGAVRVELPLDITALIFRVDNYSGGVDMRPEATEFRANLRIQPASDYATDPGGGATRILPEIAYGVPIKTASDTLVREAPVLYLRQLQEAVHSDVTPPLTPQEQAVSDAFDAAFGPDGANVDLGTRIAFGAGARAAHDALVNNYLDHVDENGWVHFTNIGHWSDEEVLDRASISEFIQYGNGINTAGYYHTFTDGNGDALDGSDGAGYVLSFPAGEHPPAERFWSVTAYTPNAIQLIPNPIEKYLVASYTPGLVTNPSGSVSIHISREKPPGVPEANWLPVGDRPFNLMLRIYGVGEDSSVADNTYVPPPVVRRYGSR